ncbi:hypothetical protein PCASD_24756 [Puccinia coronata f. sp. avenae]|uniref:HAT C-terminal dimerisation domain-containing protein n=2 Tax=Puccinia coronata f. sp. avenae TaxID=200324 RepID=A0A2N5SAI1_9BASI|nr:hypothetical protein PCASD_24756 [Puccinia coronata f. sp. avenae]
MAKVVKTHAKKKKVTVHNSDSESKAPDGHSKDENRSESESKQDPAVNVMDLTQDSNADNAKAIEKTSKKAQGPSVSEFDNVGLCFHPPVRGKGEDNNDFNPYVDEDGEEFDADDTNLHDDSDVEAPEEMQGNIISKTLKKVDFVIQKITSSAAKQSEFAIWSKKLNYKGPTLIAGYGICWNVKWQSQDRAYQACNIIAQLIENERERQEREGSKNSFQDFEITRSDWDIVKRLNDILSLNTSPDFLKDRHAAKVDPKVKFNTLILRIIKKTNAYLNEALACDTVLLATMLHPTYRLSIFQLCFPSHHDYSTPTHRRFARKTNYFPDATEGENMDKLGLYLSGKYKISLDNANECLAWWRNHCQEFPVLSKIAKDYLACSASVERCFSAAANICGRDRGSLGIRTIERCVNSHQWLHQGFKANGDFETAQGIINQAMDETSKAKTKPPIASTSASSLGKTKEY